MIWSWRVGLGVAFVIFYGVREMLCDGLAERGGLVEEDDWAQRAFGEFEQRALPRFGSRAEVRGIFPGGFFGAVGFFGRRDGPLGERQQCRSNDWRDGALRARIEFADGLDGVAEKFDSNGALRFG